MKKILFPGLVMMIVISACLKNNEATISGTIEKSGNSPLLIADYKITNIPDTIRLINGTFHETFQINNPGFKFLMFGRSRKELFLAPGYSINISFSATNFDSTYKIKGKGAIENIILDSVLKIFQKLDYSLVYKRTSELATKYIDSSFEAYRKYLDKLTKSKQIDPVFIEYENKSLEYEAAGLKIDIGEREKIKDTNYYGFLKSIELENDKYLDIPRYRKFLSNYVYLKSDEISNTIINPKSKLHAEFFDATLKAIEKLKNKKIKEFLIFNEINDRLKYNGVDFFSSYKDYFTKHNTDSVYARELQKNYNKKLLLAAGKPAPEFMCVDINNNKVSLSDFRGKYVYIDFWATWCGPCRGELPHYIKIQSKYKGKNIVFASISIDEDRNSWEAALKQNKSGCISLIGDNGWNSKAAKAYQIYAIPTFVLIDKEGKIISAQAPRPSSFEINKTLDSLLEVKK